MMSVSLIWVSEREGVDDPSETTEAGKKRMRYKEHMERAHGTCHETGAALTLPRTLAVCEPRRRVERLENLPTSVAESVKSLLLHS